MLRLFPQAALMLGLAGICCCVLHRPLLHSQNGHPVEIHGATYYVDSTAGSDSNSGNSPTSPWKSLEKVNQTTFRPGDSIHFKSGSEWSGQLWPKGSGAEGRPVLVDKYGGETRPVIHGNGVEDAVLLKNQEYWEVSNLEITNAGDGKQVRRGVHLAAENYGDVHHLYLRSLVIRDVIGTDKEKVNGGIHYTSSGNSRPTRFIDLRIEDNVIEHVDRSGIFGWSTHWVRKDWYPSLRVLVRNNTLRDIGGDGIVVVATDGALIEGNVVGKANQRSQGYNVGIWAWSADNTIIQRNEVYGTRGQRDGEGFDSDWNSRNTTIQYNYSHDNDGGFLLICNEGAMDASLSAGNSGTIARYNISQNDHHRGINVAGPVTGAEIYNNTIYVGKGEDVGMLLHSNWKGWAKDTHLYNNIFYVEGVAKFSYARKRRKNGEHVTSAGFGKSQNTVFDSNVYFGMAPAEDSHSLTSDPRLQRPGSALVGRGTAAGFIPETDSPVIDSGKAVAASGGKDFFGNPSPACGGTDRGAVEKTNCRNAAKP